MKPPRLTPTDPRLPRRGFTVTEVFVTFLLLGVTLGAIAPAARRAATQRRVIHTRQAALLAVSESLERLTADPATAPTAGESITPPLPDDLAAALPGHVLTVRAVALTGDPPGRRFDATLGLPSATSSPTAPLRLSAFLFDPPPATAEATP